MLKIKPNFSAQTERILEDFAWRRGGNSVECKLCQNVMENGDEFFFHLVVGVGSVCVLQLWFSIWRNNYLTIENNNHKVITLINK